jgi:aspartate/tyrosine/aromatic aminotransferase
MPPLDITFDTYNRYLADKHPKKISMVMGIYRDDNVQPIVWNVIRKIEKEIVSKDYFKVSLKN